MSYTKELSTKMRSTVNLYKTPVTMAVSLEAMEEGMICEACSAVDFEPKPLSPAAPVKCLKLPLMNPEKVSHVPSASDHDLVIKSCVHLNMFITKCRQEPQSPLCSFSPSIFFSSCLLGPHVSHLILCLSSYLLDLITELWLYIYGRTWIESCIFG